MRGQALTLSRIFQFNALRSALGRRCINDRHMNPAGGIGPAAAATI